MNRIVKRIAAGSMAAAILVSAVGSDAFTGLYEEKIYAAESTDSTIKRLGRSTGFDNLEQDTDKDTGKTYYNTGYGLHTNKTASVAEGSTDGRTFDVDLESWYVGENPVDVATILDASGSMAWTVDTLEPLDIDYDCFNDYEKEHSVTINTFADLQGIQEDNEGYLPQEIVDLILKPGNTDDTKLSYAGYKYYVYEDRSAVSEFVPLGYWDGGEPSGALEPIGYYPFNGSLENEINGDSAILINHAEEGGEFDSEKTPVLPVSPTAIEGDTGSIDLSKSIEKGALLLDVNAADTFTIGMRIKSSTQGANGSKYRDVPLAYIGDETGKNYIYVYRQGGTDARKIIINICNNGTKKNKAIEFSSVFTDNSDWNNIILSYNGTTLNVNIYKNNASTAFKTGTYTLTDFNTENFRIIIGEELSENTLPYSDVKLTAFCVYSECLNDSNISKLNQYMKNLSGLKENNITDRLTAYYGFDNCSLENEVSADKESIQFIEQPTPGSGGNVVGKALDPVPAEPVYSSNSLNVTQTSKLGSVLLDAVPKNDGDFTISFKIKKSNNDDSNKENGIAQIMYLGDVDTSEKDYYHIARNWQIKDSEGNKIEGINDDRHLRFHDKDTKENTAIVSAEKVFENTDWRTVTFVIDDETITSYVKEKSSTSPKSGLTKLKTTDINIIIAGLVEEYTGSDILLDDLYVFDKALDSDEVKRLSEGKLSEDPVPKSCGGYHATKSDGVNDIAQISEGLAGNPDDEARRGWYYVNSHTTWADVEGCLASGKEYIGIQKDQRLGEQLTEDDVTLDEDESIAAVVTTEIADDNKSVATVPSTWQAVYDKYHDEVDANPEAKLDSIITDEQERKYYENYESLKKGNDDKPYEYNGAERSIQFYVDSQGYLRCFFNTGDTSWKKSNGKWSYSPRTFCSLVYQKEEIQQTKYEALNGALNTFYQNLAEKSDLSNTAIVRFSTVNAVSRITSSDKTEEDKNKKKAATNTNLKKLIMEEWTNYSDEYTNASTARKDYLQNLLIPAPGESAVPTDPESKEYPYVMTGGTYTWTGLKAFYDNMVNNEDDTTVKDIANDARDKYLIIFTDGRDNTQDYNVDENGTPNYNTGSTFKDTKYVNNYNPYADDTTHRVGFSYDGKVYKPDNHTIKYDGDLAEAWADKLKDEGYTIYCVMMATGSISPTANKAEYERAYNFMKTLAGSKEETDFDNQIIVVDPSDKDGKSVTDAFEQILEQIQLPRKDYNVQDYIDPRFDLVDKNNVVLKLGAGGVITNSEGEEIKTVGDIIDAAEGTDPKTLGYPYTPIESEMVNREPDSKFEDGYNNGDDIGTGYIFYDDDKDMYYLRWENQVIPMEDEAFNTNETETAPKYLDVWSATIRLKAKDDFIGGNNILTNGNEAGENLVYSDATIENIDKGKNYELYGFKDTDLKEIAGKEQVPLRKKLEILSGTNRKINAVDADGVSQAVYGNGIDIPSSGFPRTTVNVRLLKLDAKNLNDVIYMGEVVSPTMMLADLENDYMTGSYYLQYLERYAYRLYGDELNKKPLIELLNEWLKINDVKALEKTFTIPYIYLPDPVYVDDKLQTDSTTGRVEVSNNTGASWDTTTKHLDFTDLNLRDVTGFITYSWKRDEDSKEKQQLVEGTTDEYDITKEYVVKNTDQIKYILQLKFTPLKERALAGFSIDDEKFITTETTTGTGASVDDKFFEVNDKEFAPRVEKKWKFTNRTEYLQAMVQEAKTYEPHVMYDETEQKWVLVDESKESFKSTDAVEAYVTKDESKQTVKNSADGKEKEVIDTGVYDWDSDYKPTAGDEQLEKGEDNNIKGFYTNSPNNVKLLAADGKTELTDETGAYIDGAGEPVSITANTTYIKDVVNGALALELVVNGKYLQDPDSPLKQTDKTYTFEATRYYTDPNDPLPYTTSDTINANVDGKKYQLTFKIEDPLPASPKDGELYTIWAKLTKVEVDVGTGTSDYKLINTDPDTVGEAIKPYVGYADEKSLPIGTYEISATDKDMTEGTPNATNKYYIGKDTSGGTSENVFFKYLKIDNAPTSYTQERFPETVTGVSEDAVTDTKDGEYLIKNGSTDNSPKNIAESSRVKTEAGSDTTQTLTFNLGTVDKDGVKGKKGESVKDNPDTANDYAKDRLGIILLSADSNTLTISKKVDNTPNPTEKQWTFKITVKTDDTEWARTATTDGVKLQWFEFNDTRDDWVAQTTIPADYPNELKFELVTDTTDEYTAEISFKHNEKVTIKGLPEGKWQVEELNPEGLFYSVHNNAHEFVGDEWKYQNTAETEEYDLKPNSYVDYINEMPYELPSAGGIGRYPYIAGGALLTAAGALYFAVSRARRKKAEAA